ncbi:unnamed protein product [Acanthosepion pharaonis]|uniref:Uncharacterized protein n=1 Tax=Acanthosepion pharaonis TaxID=158019 RepID=A0A812DC15_ACAPH|nr:unnamed protein product [Sepia pharaonis]
MLHMVPPPFPPSRRRALLGGGNIFPLPHRYDVHSDGAYGKNLTHSSEAKSRSIISPSRSSISLCSDTEMAGVIAQFARPAWWHKVILPRRRRGSESRCGTPRTASALGAVTLQLGEFLQHLTLLVGRASDRHRYRRWPSNLLREAQRRSAAGVSSASHFTREKFELFPLGATGRQSSVIRKGRSLAIDTVSRPTSSSRSRRHWREAMIRSTAFTPCAGNAQQHLTRRARLCELGIDIERQHARRPHRRRRPLRAVDSRSASASRTGTADARASAADVAAAAAAGGIGDRAERRIIDAAQTETIIERRGAPDDIAVGGGIGADDHLGRLAAQARSRGADLYFGRVLPIVDRGLHIGHRAFDAGGVLFRGEALSSPTVGSSTLIDTRSAWTPASRTSSGSASGIVFRCQRQVHHLLRREARTADIGGLAIDAIMAVEDAAIGQQDLQQRDAAAIGRIGVADPHPLGRSDPLAVAAVAFGRARRGAGCVIFRGIGQIASFSRDKRNPRRSSTVQTI